MLFVSAKLAIKNLQYGVKNTGYNKVFVESLKEWRWIVSRIKGKE